MNSPTPVQRDAITPGTGGSGMPDANDTARSGDGTLRSPMDNSATGMNRAARADRN